MAETSSSPDISLGKSESLIVASFKFSRFALSMASNRGDTKASNSFSVVLSALDTGNAFKISVLRLVKTLPLPKEASSFLIYLKNR